MSEKISRRNFLRTATLGAAAAGLLAGLGGRRSPSQPPRRRHLHCRHLQRHRYRHQHRHPRHRDHDIQR